MSTLRQRPRRPAPPSDHHEPPLGDETDEQESSGEAAADTPSSDEDDEDVHVDTNNDDDDDHGKRISVLDVLRIIFVLVAGSCALSFYMTSSESLIWGYKRPWFTKLPQLTRYIRGPLHLTPAQLSLYNGTSPSLPLYLSINGTIFDVSAGRHAYGPGASYSIFAGRDATRAFVTGCFHDDLTDDLRGVEEMFIPVEDDPGMEEERVMSEVQTQKRKVRELRAAREKVRATVEGWQAFYAKHERYFEVGKLVKTEGHTGNERTLCQTARKARPKRSKLREKERKKREKGKT